MKNEGFFFILIGPRLQKAHMLSATWSIFAHWSRFCS